MKSLSLSKPHLIVMVGMPGAGKSFFAAKFADTFNAPRICYDTIREIVSGAQPTFSREEQTVIEYLASNQLDELFKTNSTIIVDGGSEARTARLDLMHRAKNNGYKTLFVWVQTDPATAKQRATVGMRGRGSQAILLDSDQYDALARRFTPPNQSEPFIVISGKHTYATQARTILKKLSEPRAEQATTAKPTNDRPPKPGHRVIIR